MIPRHGIVAGGNWLIDRVKLIDVWPPQDSLASILEQSLSNGGSPYNVLKALARLGAPFPLHAVGLVGDDADGRWIRDDCRHHNIDTTQLHATAAAPTSGTDVMTVASTGRRTFFHHRAANALLSAEHFDFSTTRAKLFHLGYLLLLDQLDRPDAQGRPHAWEVLSRARAAGLRTSLDCVSEPSDRFRTVVAPVLPQVDILFANDFEVEKLTGIDVRPSGEPDPAAARDAAEALLAKGVREWAVVHFPEAVVAASPGGEFLWQPSLRVPRDRIRGAAGAGDALAAGILFGLHEEWPMARALELGVCAAAASLEHPSCSESLRPASACLALAQTYGFRTQDRATRP